MARLWVMAMVLQSTTTDPARTPSTIPLGPRMTSFTMAVSPTQRNRTSAFSATSFGVAQNLPFSVLASFWALAEVLDQTATSCPARRRLRAMGYPMSPSPRNPNLGMKLDCTRMAGRGANRVDPWRCQSVATLTFSFSWSSRRLRRVAASAVYQSLVLIMRAYPEPVEDIVFAHSERSVRFGLPDELGIP